MLVGDGHEKARLARRVRRRRSGTTWRCSPPVPKAQIPALLARIDIAYIGWQRVPIYRFGIAPNKLMDYMMAGVPVLHSVDAGNDPVAEAGCGLTVAPEAAGCRGRGPAAAGGAERRRTACDGRARRAFVRAQHSYRCWRGASSRR